ncbi:MAG: hypothetical protein QME42_11475 [bacterium]|nr:hypothetical protein [bacterium]
MQAYKFETEVLPTGMIPLPKNYDHLKSHQVEIIIIDKKEEENWEKRFEDTLNRVRMRNRKFSEEEIMADVNKAVEEIRKLDFREFTQ